MHWYGKEKIYVGHSWDIKGSEAKEKNPKKIELDFCNNKNALQ